MAARTSSSAPGGRQCDPVLVGLDLLRDADLHGAEPYPPGEPLDEPPLVGPEPRRRTGDGVLDRARGRFASRESPRRHAGPASAT